MTLTFVPHRLADRLRQAGVAALLGVAAPVAADVQISGLDSALHDNVLAVLRLDEELCDAPRRRVEVAFDRAESEIRLALEAFGFYSPQISAALNFEDACWEATFDVGSGQPVVLRDVNVSIEGEAGQDEVFREILAGTAVRAGEPLQHARYERLKESLRAASVERGYFDGEFTATSIDVYPDEFAADVDIQFVSGPRYRFGAIELSQDVLSDELLRRYADPEPGSYYNSRLLAQTRLDLINSGYFDAVAIQPGNPDPQTLEVPVTIRVTPSARAQISYGFGLSTDTGPRFRFGRSIRRVNSSGHQINVNGLFSPVVIEASADYRLPYGDPRSEWVSFDIGGIREETDTATGRSLQFGARRVVAQADLWTRTDQLGMLVEDFDVGSQSGRSRLLMPGVEFARRRADDAVRPQNGSRLQFLVRAASDRFGSDTGFTQFVASGKWIWSPGLRSRILVRGELGRTWFDQFTDLPPSIRFFAGGDDSVRGFDFETLGPENEAGEVIGGSRLLTASIEYERQIRGPWSIALFSDAGNAFSDSSASLRRSAGFGVRWQSPLGPVRVDLARPVNGPDRDVRLHITLGPDL